MNFIFSLKKLYTSTSNNIEPPNGLQPAISRPVGKLVGDDPLTREVIYVDTNVTDNNDNIEPDVNKLIIIRE